MNIQNLPITAIHPDPANARLHPTRNLDQIKASLQRFGQQKPLVIDSKNIVRAGNGTLAAAIALGWTHINVVQSDLPASELTAYAIADNRSAELAEWDNEVLAQTLQLPDIGDVGFTTKEIDAMLPKLDDIDLPKLQEQWLIVVTCDDEAHQAELLERFTGEGITCKALLG